MEMATESGVPALAIGKTGGSRIRMAVAGELAVDSAAEELESLWNTALERNFRRPAGVQ
jgi:hypothetical protein